MLSPSFAEVQDWWLTWVQDCLDAGADGIEMRVRNHHSTLAWREFGFEKPVRDEFLKRYGVDLWKTDDFDLAAWRQLRGEAYTQFYRRVRELTRRHGKPMGLHISPTTGVMEPEQGAAMEIHWDWRRWLREGLCDSVTMKEIWPRTSLAEEDSVARPSPEHSGDLLPLRQQPLAQAGRRAGRGRLDPPRARRRLRRLPVLRMLRRRPWRKGRQHHYGAARFAGTVPAAIRKIAGPLGAHDAGLLAGTARNVIAICSSVVISTGRPLAAPGHAAGSVSGLPVPPLFSS